MRLEIVTIVLDGMPWITHHLPTFNRLSIDWRWTIAHGVSQNLKDTSWMQPQLPRLSNDGTTEYLSLIANHPRVRVLERKMWLGKTSQINACLEGVAAPAAILQVDADEVWTASQIEAIASLLETRAAPGEFDRMQFWCRYFLGPNIVAVGHGNSYGCRNAEWMRAWIMRDDQQRFTTHEPPVFDNNRGQMMSRDATREHGLIFDHFAYATKRQLEFKERVYNYRGAVAGWESLQKNDVWPAKLKLFMPWVDDSAVADLLVR